MRFSALVPFLLSLAALVLSFLCLFAGSKKSFLQGADIMTLNTSEIGYSSLFNTSDGDGSLLSSLENSIESEIDSLISDAEEDIAQALGLFDFYSIHVMDYCEGYFEPNGTASGAKKNTTECSNTTLLFNFDPEKVLSEQLNSTGLNVTLSDLGWPDALTDGIHALRIAFKVMFVFYIIAIIFTGLSVLGALIGVILSGRLSAFANWALSLLAFLCLGIASAISTVIAVKAVHEINKYGDDINVSASWGKEFMGMTWAATAAMFVASCIWVLECCAGRRKSTYKTKEMS